MSKPPSVRLWARKFLWSIDRNVKTDITPTEEEYIKLALPGFVKDKRNGNIGRYR